MKETTKIETVKTESFEMEYFRFGHGNKTMVILPGLSVDGVMKYADAVADAYKSMTDDFTIYLFERRKNLPEIYSVEDMAFDTAEAIRELGLNHIYLFGASQGGMISMLIALNEPELVEKMVLGSTAACVSSGQFEKTIGEWIGFAKEGKREDLYLSFGKAVYPKKVFEASQETLKTIAGTLTNEDFSRFVILASSVRGFDITNRLNRITCPVLVLGSTDDNVLGGDSSKELYESFKTHDGCELYLYDTYGHAAYDLAPDYKERMLRFFNA